MRRHAIAILAGTILLSAACDKAPEKEDAEAAEAGRAPGDYFTVRAGPVANAKLGALSGNFQLLKVAAANGIPSSGLGGACIVFAPADLGLAELAAKSCSSNQDCQGSSASAAYCDIKTRSCWARPASDPTGAKTCNRPVAMTPTTLNPVPATPVDAGSLGVRAGAKARVVACLNKGGPPWPTPRPPCGQIDSPDRIEVMGPVATVQP